MKHAIRLLMTAGLCSILVMVSAQSPALPSTPLSYGFLKATFGDDGKFTITGSGWPTLSGTWKTANGEIELGPTAPPASCAEPGKYRYKVDGKQVGFELVTDTCMPRRMMIGGSVWLPAGEKPVIPQRRLVRTLAPTRRALPTAAPATGSWPSFRGVDATGVADGQHLPDTWDGKSGANILWHTPIPGLGTLESDRLGRHDLS